MLMNQVPLLLLNCCKVSRHSSELFNTLHVVAIRFVYFVAKKFLNEIKRAFFGMSNTSSNIFHVFVTKCQK